MIAFVHFLNGALMLAVPLAAAAFVQRRLGVGWGLFGAGAIVFVGSQIVHIPLNLAGAAVARRLDVPAGVAAWLLPVALGLSAGLCEELARYLALSAWLKKVRSSGPALMVGLGHGGIESMILGGLVLVGWVQMMALRNGVPDGTPPETAAAVAAYWAMSPLFSMLGIIERIPAIACHVGWTALVLQGVLRRQPLWVVAAVLLHAALDAGAVALAPRSIVLVEVLGGAFGIGMAGLVWALWTPEPAPVPEAPIEPVRLERRALGERASDDGRQA